MYLFSSKKIIGTFIGGLFLIGNVLSVVLILLLHPSSELGNYGENPEIFLDLIYNKPW